MIHSGLKWTGSFAALALLASAIPVKAEVVYGLSANSLFTFDSSQPSSVGNSHAVTGLQGDRLIGIDVRPETGFLYGLGSSLRLYTLDPNTGSASLVNENGIGSFGTSYGFDFNPVVDAARVVNNNSQNFRISPSGNLIGMDSSLAYAVNDPNFGRDPSVVGIAYFNNNPDATTTSLFGIDSSTDTLTLIPSPNSGVLNTVGLLGVNTTEKVAFDIGGSGKGFASLTKPGENVSGFYAIDLANGKASFLGNVGVASQLDGIAVSAVPEPSTWALLATGLSLIVFRRRAVR